MKIIMVKHDESNEIIGYKTDDEQVLDNERAILLAEAGQIDGVEVISKKNGNKYLRSIPNGLQQSLNNLPEF